MSAAKRATLFVRLQPKASRSEIIGFKEGALHLKVTAPPVEGAANRALESFLAGVLGLRKSQVSVVQGHKSREKVLEIIGLSEDEVRGKLGG
ncbi:MAG: DUF167 domain-containing protein [Armatimonadetes bacterium]|nr:DUF167 domain-containing protein [Armatimonadota bacterium]